MGLTRFMRAATALATGAAALILLALIVIGSGCASGDRPSAGTPPDKSGLRPETRAGGGAPRDPKHLAFENSADPPMKSETRFAAGRLAESQEDPKRAIEQYNACLKIDPKHRDALYRLGVVHAAMQHFPEAIIAWKKYVAVTDGDAAGYSNLGFCYELSGSNDEAEAAYKKGVVKDPKSNACRVNYGLMLARNGRVNEATVQLQAVLTPAEVHYNLASVYEMQGRKETARIEYQRALETEPNFTDALVRMTALR